MTTSVRPRRFRFGLRTLFVLVAVASVFLAWLTVQLKWIQDRHAALHLTLRMGAAPAPWSIRILGEQGVDRIGVQYLGDERADGARVRAIQLLFPEAHVELGDIDEYGKKHHLPELK
jgi:hypothetical protein